VPRLLAYFLWPLFYFPLGIRRLTTLIFIDGRQNKGDHFLDVVAKIMAPIGPIGFNPHDSFVLCSGLVKEEYASMVKNLGPYLKNLAAMHDKKLVLVDREFVHCIVDCSDRKSFNIYTGLAKCNALNGWCPRHPQATRESRLDVEHEPPIGGTVPALKDAVFPLPLECHTSDVMHINLRGTLYPF
jgi:hypothetical protein